MPKFEDLPEKIKPFVFHGMIVAHGKKESKSDCPICGREDHFFIKTATGQYDCKRCGSKGNIAVFLATLWELSYEKTTTKDYAPLAKERGIPASELREWGVAKSIIGDDWLIPAYNTDGKLANVYKVVKDHEGKWRALGTPGCKAHPFGTALLNKNQTFVYVTEGPWDGMAWRDALKQTRLKKDGGFVKTQDESRAMIQTHGVMSSPGAGTFNEDWFDHLQDLDAAFLCYDNDHPKKTPAGNIIKPGWDGMKRVVKLCSESAKQPRELYRLTWGPKGYDTELPSGYDLRDLKKDHGPVEAIAEAMSRMKKAKLTTVTEVSEDEKIELVEPIPRKSFAALCKDFESVLYFHPNMRDSLMFMFAISISTPLDGDQIFGRVLGPPGSGKTTLAECFAVAREYVYPKSTFTGVHSGFIGSGKNKKKDAGLIPLIQGKMWLVKDGDTLINAPNRAKTLSDVRDIWDGASRSHYRNHRGKDYEGIKTTMCVCGTDTLRELNHASAGDRFLDCEILGKGQSAKPFTQKAIANTYSKFAASLKRQGQETDESEVKDKDKSTYLKQCTYGFLKYLHENLGTFPVPEFPESVGLRIEALGEFLSYMRAKPKRDGENLMYRPRIELATRLCSQMTKLAGCLAIVLGKKKIDDEVYRVVRKIALDTAEGFQHDITQALASRPDGMSYVQIANAIKLGESTVKRAMQDMADLGIVVKYSRPNRSGVRGRHMHLWELSPAVRKLHKLLNKSATTIPRAKGA
jgi:hypothetical protein